MPAVGFREDTIIVEGLSELRRAFARCEGAARKEVDLTLRAIAEPVRRDAEALAASTIRNIGPAWSLMRVGTDRAGVYVAPKQRGRRSRQNPKLRRPNLADLLLNRSMLPALHANKPVVDAGMQQLLANLGHTFEEG